MKQRRPFFSYTHATEEMILKKINQNPLSQKMTKHAKIKYAKTA